MKITATILSIPPHLSTTWKNISSLHVQQENGSYTLVVLLQNRAEISVPGLSKSQVDQIFEAHAQYAETENTPVANPFDTPLTFNLPLDKNGGMLDAVTTSMQHNSEQANLDPMPPEVLKKITAIAKAFGLDEAESLPKAEPHCNCVYCQVARAMQGEEAVPAELEVSEEDLKFRNWEIAQTADKLYNVTNPLDTNEHYSVFLGDPLGCTCGERNCEHIRAVLNT